MVLPINGIPRDEIKASNVVWRLASIEERIFDTDFLPKPDFSDHSSLYCSRLNRSAGSDTQFQSISFSNVALDNPLISKPFFPAKWSSLFNNLPSQFTFPQINISVLLSHLISVFSPQIGHLTGISIEGNTFHLQTSLPNESKPITSY